MIKETGFALFLFTISLLCQSETDLLFLEGEWALNPNGQTTTSILQFHKDGMVENSITSVMGKYQFLNDERILIEFDDGLMIGKLDKTDQGYELKGIFYPPSQRINLELSMPTKNKRSDAQAFQNDLLKNITKVQTESIAQAITNNLATIAAAAQMQLLIEGKTEVEFAEIVGPDKLVSQIQSVYGEIYDQLKITYETRKLVVIDKNGKEHAYEF